MEEKNIKNNSSEEWFNKLEKKKKNSVATFIFELIKVVLISVAIVVPVRYFLIQPFLVKGASMEPNFHDKEYLIINEIGYRIDPPQRGDVVVIRYPKDPKQYFLKRVIGLPNETIKINDGEVFIYNSENPQGFRLEESYLEEGVDTYGAIDVSLKGNEYFVLGDNRQFSLDSRIFGTVDKNLIVGRAWIRGWPFSKFGMIEHATY